VKEGYETEKEARALNGLKEPSKKNAGICIGDTFASFEVETEFCLDKFHASKS
jgi:hypothetical protein